MSLYYNFPIYTETKIAKIIGNKRVEGVYLVNKLNGDKKKIDCDTVIVTGKFSPESALLHDTGIELDSSTSGPAIDLNYQTSIPSIYAVGNVLRGANTHDRCALEGQRAGRIISKIINQKLSQPNNIVWLKASSPIRYVVPQKMIPYQAMNYKTSTFTPCVGIQVDKTLRQPQIQAYSGSEMIWEKRLSKIIGDTNIPIPIEKFDWNRVDINEGIELKVAQ
jgi:hypothetical protein